MVEPAPIFLLKNDETEGPYDALEVEDMLEGGEISENTLSCIEGMKGWRSVPETFLWSYAKLLNLFSDQAASMTDRMASRQLETREARSEIRDALVRANCFKYAEVPEALSQVLYINGLLLEHHRRYVSRQQDWDADVMEFYPASKMVLFGKQQFVRDWDSEWQKSAPLPRGKKIAKKGALIWSEISDFAFPFPPFSMDPSAWVEDVSIDEARRLGVQGLDTPIVLPEINQFELVGL